MTLERYKVEELKWLPSGGLTGRRKITTAAKEITAANVRDVLSKALAVHAANAAEIEYLWNVYCGRQDIRDKVKLVRENINEKVCVDLANQTVTFTSAYILSEPIQYVSTGGSDELAEKITVLNDYMRAEEKESKDKEIVDWVLICGVGERFTITDAMAGVEGGAPYYIDTLDPREAFVIYSSRIRKEPMAGVILQVDENDRRFAVVYTRNKCFTVTKDSVTEEDHILGEIPLVEYTGNMARMACFEAGLSVQNAINELESNALDAIKDFVNGFDVFSNCEIDDGSYKDLSLGGKAVKIKTVTQGMEAKVYRIASELNQSGVQQRIDDLTEKYLSLCGMPLRSGGESTSDTGTATIFRNGWYETESRAKDFEKLFKRSERRFLKLVLNILDAKAPIGGLELKDIDISFGRENLNNLQSRFQCLCEALANDKIHPLSAFGAFGDIFGDKTRAYQMGMAWYEKQKTEEQALLDDQLDAERERIKRNSETTGTVPSGGQNDREAESDGSFEGE